MLNFALLEVFTLATLIAREFFRGDDGDCGAVAVAGKAGCDGGATAAAGRAKSDGGAAGAANRVGVDGATAAAGGGDGDDGTAAAASRTDGDGGIVQHRAFLLDPDQLSCALRTLERGRATLSVVPPHPWAEW